MTTELRLAEALKEMMAGRSLDQITVKNLTELSGITRPTFYYHFHDIYDLLAWIFLNETIDGLEKTKTWVEALSKIGRYCLNNRSLILKTYESAGKDLLLEFLNNNLYSFHMRLLSELDKENKILEEARKQIAIFYSAAANAILSDWIRQGMKVNLNDITKELSDHIGNYMNTLNKGYQHEII